MHAISLLTLLPLVLAAPANTRRAEPAPLLRPRGAELIPGQYIVKLKDGVSTASLDDTLSILPGEAKHVYTAAGFTGFASKLDKATLEAVQNHPDVDYVEQDGIARINAFTTQSGATWGISRVSHKSKGATTYSYDDTAGAGTCAYIIDTGIYTAHAVRSPPSPYPPNLPLRPLSFSTLGSFLPTPRRHFPRAENHN